MIALKQFILRIPYWAYLLLVAVLVINAFYIIARMNIPVDGVGLKLITEGNLVRVVRHNSPAEKAGILAGDIISHLENQPVTGVDYHVMIESYKPGDVLQYKIIRGEKVLTVPVTLGSFWSQYPWFYFILYSVIFFITVTSLYILYKKPNDNSVKVFYIYLSLFAIAQNTRFLFLDETYATIANIAFVLSFNLFGPALLHFHLLFAQPLKSFKRIKNLLFLVYTIGFLLSLLVIVQLIRRNYSGTPDFNTFYLFSKWSIAWMGLTLFMALLLAVYRFRKTHEVHISKQIWIVLVGSVIGLLTPILFSIFPDFIWRIDREYHLPSILEFTNAFGSYAMITFLAIAIFRYRIWDIETIIRRFLLYLAATITTFLVYFILLFIIDKFSYKLSQPVHFLILVLSVILFLMLRDEFQKIIDRMFQRESYDSAKVVEEFEEKLAGVYQPDELKHKIIKGLDDIFHFESLLFVLRKNNFKYEIAGYSGSKILQADSVFEISPELDSLIKSSRVFTPEEFPIAGQGNLIISGADLVIPIQDGEKSFGFFVAGSKRSEKSYTLQDIRVLTLLSRRIVALFHTATLFKKDLDRQLLLERERSRIAEDMHDEVGASLTRISILSEMTRNNSGDSNKISPWLNQISETSRKVMEEMNQIIWALNPKNDNLGGLMAYIRRFASEYLEPTGLKYTINLPFDMPQFNLTVEERRNIYLVIREALHNIVKHSGAKEVRIALQFTPPGFRINVQDDGRGFDREKLVRAGNGLTNMNKRMTDIGGSLLINSSPGKGTELILDIQVSDSEKK